MIEFPELRGRGPIGVDCETRDPYLKSHGPGYCFRDGGEVIGVSLSVDGWAGYFPVGHAEGNLDRGMVMRWVNEQLSGPEIKLAHNALYDMGWLDREGVKIQGPWYCTQAMTALIDEHRYNYSLDNVTKDYLGEQKDKRFIEEAAKMLGCKPKEVMGRLAELPAHMVAPYAEQDARLLPRLWEKHKVAIEHDDLWKVLALEMDLLPVLLDMRKRGMRVDLDKADRLRTKYKQMEADAVKQIRHVTGVHCDPWMAEQCRDALEWEGTKCPTTPKTGAPSVTAPFLLDLAAKGSKVAPLILQARKAQKTYSTFIENSIFAHEKNGRVHAQFHSLKKSQGDNDTSGTISGRFSSTDPNLQQLPARDEEIGPEIRSAWCADEGEETGTADYSQQEPRLTVHYAALMELTGAREAARRYTEEPDTDYHQFVAELAGIPRKPAKTINLGLAYGMGGPKLCRSLGLPTKWIEVDDWRKEAQPTTLEDGSIIMVKPKMKMEVAGEEGQAILDAYDAGVPFVKELKELCTRRAKKRGWIRTLEGRLSRFPMGQDGKRWYTHTAMNRLVQGGSADQTKRAMVDIHRAGIKISAQVHDELIFSLRNRSEAKDVKEIMEHCVKLLVPSRVDVKIGPSWGEAK